MGGRIAAIVPAHNEDKVVEETLQALKDVFPVEDIYLVDDFSTDETAVLAKKIIKNVYTTPENVGKANAINLGIEHFQIKQRYEFIVPVDADTKLGKDFGEQVISQFDLPENSDVAAIAGRVVGSTKTWLTAYRMWEYEIGQTIHKQAQSYINGITVCPGCSTVYRSSVFNTLEMPLGTLTEDMDMTFQIHRNKVGRILFNSKARVYTQDPNSLKDFLKQLDRWYVGLWQNISKHGAPFGRQKLDFELALLATEGLLNGLFMASMAVLIPILIATNPIFLLLILGAELLLFSLPSILYVAIKNRSLEILRFIFHFLFIRIVSSIVFLFSFLKVTLGMDKRTKWQSPTRYKMLTN